MRTITILALLLVACGGHPAGKTSTTTTTTKGTGTCSSFDISSFDATVKSADGVKQTIEVETRGDIPKGTDLTWSVDGEGVEVLDHSVKGSTVLSAKLDFGGIDPGETGVLTVSVTGRCDKSLVVFRELIDLCRTKGGLEILPYESSPCKP